MRNKLRGGIMAVILTVALFATGLSLSTGARADETAPTELGTVTTATEAGTGLSVQAVNKAMTSGIGRAHLTIDLRDEGGEGIELPGVQNDRYLAIWITGKHNPVQNTLPATWFYMEGVRADKTTIDHTHTTASYRTTAPAFYKDGETWKPAVVERGGCNKGSTNGTSGRTMFRTPSDATLLPEGCDLNRSANLPESVVFLPFSTMRAGTGLKYMQYFTLSQEITADGRFNEYAKISVVTLPAFKVNGNVNDGNNVDGTKGKFNGFIPADASDFDAPLAAPDEVLAVAAQNETVLVDFTQYSQADIDAAWESGKFKTHVTANNVTAKDWFGLTPTASGNNGPLASTDNNATYAQYFRLDAGKEVSARLNAPLDGALRIGYARDAARVDNSEGSESNSHSVMAYLTLWEAATDDEVVDVSDSSGFAVKLRGLADNTQFRLHFYDKDGSVYIAGSTPSAREQGVYWPFVDEAGEKGTILEYNKGILLNRGDCGTMYMRFDVCMPYESENNRKTFNGPIEGDDVIPLTRARITSIRKVVLSYNVSINNAAVLNARMDIGSLADVNASTGEMTEIFDTADYTFALSAEDATADVNPYAPALGRKVTADSKNAAGEAETFKNDAWLLARAARYAVETTADGNGGAVGGSANGTYESLSYIDLAAVWASDFAFMGWQDADGATVCEQEEYSTVLRGDLTLAAVFVQRYYRIEFYSEDKTVAEFRVDSFDETQLIFTIEAKEIADPVRAGYAFDGWTLDGVPVGKTDTIEVEGDMVFAAAWTANEYTIRFDSDGGSAVDPITQTCGSEVTVPQAPTKVGHTFAGWTLDGQPYVFGTMPTEDLELKAVWTINTYTITFTDEDGSVLATVNAAYGTIPEYTGQTPTKAATATHTYTFAGWDKTLAEATEDATYKATYTAAEIPPDDPNNGSGDDQTGGETGDGQTGGQPEQKGCGCGSAVATTSVLWAVIAVAGSMWMLKRKRKEDR